MQFKSKSDEQSSGIYPTNWMVPIDTSDHIVGRMCQVIEMLGLKDSQEKATKDLLRKEIYSFFSQDRGCLFIDSDLVQTIWHVEEQERRHAQKLGTLPGRKGVYTLIKDLPDETSNLLED